MYKAGVTQIVIYMQFIVVIFCLLQYFFDLWLIFWRLFSLWVKKNIESFVVVIVFTENICSKFDWKLLQNDHDKCADYPMSSLLL